MDLFGWIDWELLGRLEECFWQLLNRLASINWSAWPDEKMVGLAIVAIAFICIGLYLLSRVLWALQWVLLTALILAVFIGVGLTLPEAPSEAQWGIALVVGLALAFLVCWFILGQEGRAAIRFRILERVAGREATLLAFGLEEPEKVEPEEGEANE